MHHINRADTQTISEPIELKSFRNANTVDILTGNVSFSHDKDDEELIDLMGMDISDQYLQQIKAYCSPAALTTDDYISKSYLSNVSLSTIKSIIGEHLKITDESLELKTVSDLQKTLNDDKEFLKRATKYSQYVHPKHTFKQPNHAPDLIPGKELLVHVRIYSSSKVLRSKLHQHTFNNEIVLLGSNTLDVLRDRILCPNEFRVLNDMSEDPDMEKPAYAKNTYKSGFLYIEDTFYNDTRHPTNKDYSECIRDWAQRQPEIGPFKTAIMENTTLEDLTVRLGYPQVYQHLGNCEHVFVFSDIEVLQPSDVCYSSFYPYYKSMSRGKIQYCYMCGVYAAKWYVTGSIRIPFDPALFCSSCFKLYNYVDGVKVEDFKAYPYFDKETVI